MRLSLILFICAIMNFFWGALMLIPAVVDYFSNDLDSANVFLLSALGLCFGSTLVAALSYRNWEEKPSLREMFFLTSSIWLCIGFTGSLPFYFSNLNFSFIDSFFECISGITTTGSTIFTNLDLLPTGLLLWRAMTQWIGGLGFIILAIAILPFLRIGGMQLFATENSDSSGKDSPFIASKMKHFLVAYLFVSCLCTWALFAVGMDLFDAVTHMMTCLSTGGFSTHDLSIGYYQSASIEWVLILFMVIGALPLAFIVAVLDGKWDKVKQNEQPKTFLFFLLATTVPVALIAWATMPYFSEFWETYRKIAFHVVSIVTTTGYVTENYELWGTFFIAFFFFLLITGGCTGSTSGGIKMFRFSILSRSFKRHLTLMASPHAVVIPRYNNQPVTDDIISGVTAFMTIFCSTIILSVLLLSLTGLDLVTSLSGTLTSIANVGPGLGKMIGPDKNFASLPDTAKVIFALVMLLGRLEFMTIIVLFLPKLWTKN